MTWLVAGLGNPGDRHASHAQPPLKVRLLFIGETAGRGPSHH